MKGEHSICCLWGRRMQGQRWRLSFGPSFAYWSHESLEIWWLDLLFPFLRHILVETIFWIFKNSKKARSCLHPRGNRDDYQPPHLPTCYPTPTYLLIPLLLYNNRMYFMVVRELSSIKLFPGRLRPPPEPPSVLSPHMSNQRHNAESILRKLLCDRRWS